MGDSGIRGWSAVLALALLVGSGSSLIAETVVVISNGANDPDAQTSGAFAQDVPESAIIIRDIPFLQKRPDFGGEACIAMVLQAIGHDADQDFVFDQSGVDPLLGRGCVTNELRDTVVRIGFQTPQTWFPVPTESYDRVLDNDWQTLVGEIRVGIPSAACIRRNGRDSFVLVTGIDPATDEIYFHDPELLRGAHNRMSKQEWYRSAVLSANPGGEDDQFLVRMSLIPDNVIPCRTSQSHTSADFAQHIRKLELPSDEFQVVIQPPFVVIGNQPREQVQAHAQRTVQWAVDKIKLDYFTEDPEEVIDIWLFKDKPSYDKYNVEIWGSEPKTPFGYYSPTDRALVMNISTGGGTLVHEIVHPFIASNFPACPSWFNEGLASLYEQSREEDGHIKGSTNWRLRGLQGAIGDGNVPSFEQLTSTTRRQFYNDRRGVNYAQARYLCYYLQEKGKLVEFYHSFRRNVVDDPTGYRTLQDVLGNPDMDQFKKEWQEFTMRLRF